MSSSLIIDELYVAHFDSYVMPKLIGVKMLNRRSNFINIFYVSMTENECKRKCIVGNFINIV